MPGMTLRAAHPSRPGLLVLLACAGLLGRGTASAEEGGAHDHHRAHREAIAAPARYATSVETYEIPGVTLVDQDGRRVPLASALDATRPVALNFVFTTCTTICPVMTATFSGMRAALGPDADGLRLVSISIDPEFDTPEVLKRYTERFAAGNDWRFLTGDAREIARVLRAFDAYFGSKMNHRPLTFFRAARNGRWVRVEGLASAGDLAREYRRLIGKEG